MQKARGQGLQKPTPRGKIKAEGTGGMWKAAAGTNEASTLQQAAGPLPTAALLRQALTPPSEKPALRQPPNYLLRTQLAICAGLLLFFLAARGLGWPVYAQCQAYLLQALEEGIDLSEQPELVRFASRFVEDVRSEASRWAEGMAQQAASSEQAPQSGAESTQPLVNLGAASNTNTSQMAPPDGYSLKSYIPLQDLSLPITQFSVTSGYGWRSHPITGRSDFHTGVDLAAAEGTPIAPALPGIVLDTGRSRSYGNFVLLLHADGLATRYCHMQYVFVRRGEEVDLQSVLGTVGSTGMATGPHLHFELSFDDLHYNPAKALGL